MNKTSAERKWLANIGQPRGAAIRILDIFKEMPGKYDKQRRHAGDAVYVFNYSLLSTSEPVFLPSTAKLKNAALLIAAK